MTQLSVNINKIALLRNARGRDFPSVLDFAVKCLDFGAHGITLHPRPDQRHARYSDVFDLKELCKARSVELNVEGYPCDEFLEVVHEARPAQCTLVPDEPGQITSDHGWSVAQNRSLLEKVIPELNRRDIRVSLFIDHGSEEMGLVKELNADRIELYTEPYAEAYGSDKETEIVESFARTAEEAQRLGLGVNAGHDLNLENLNNFLKIPDILEVSIGHALTVECIDRGLKSVIEGYLQILKTNS